MFVRALGLMLLAALAAFTPPAPAAEDAKPLVRDAVRVLARE